MADATEGDTNVLYLGLQAPALIAFIPGLVIHSFIIGVNVNDWWKGRSVTPVDLIVSSLGISRMCAQCFITLYLLVVPYSLHSSGSRVTLPFGKVVYIFFTYANIWLTSLLSIVYCLKISNLHTRLFLHLRRVIEQRTVYFIVASALLSILNCLTTLLLAVTLMIQAGTYNTTMTHLSKDCTNHLYILNYIIGGFFPLIFYDISSVHLFTSLYHHTRKMKMSSNLTINLETYYSAMKFVSFTFMYNTIYFTGHWFYIYYYYFYCVDILWLYIIVDFLPVLHSSYLIYRTAKLRNQMSKILQNVLDFLF